MNSEFSVPITVSDTVQVLNKCVLMIKSLGHIGLYIMSNSLLPFSINNEDLKSEERTKFKLIAIVNIQALLTMKIFFLLQHEAVKKEATDQLMYRHFHQLTVTGHWLSYLTSLWSCVIEEEGTVLGYRNCQQYQEYCLLNIACKFTLFHTQMLQQLGIMYKYKELKDVPWSLGSAIQINRNTGKKILSIHLYDHFP